MSKSTGAAAQDAARRRRCGVGGDGADSNRSSRDPMVRLRTLLILAVVAVAILVVLTYESNVRTDTGDVGARARDIHSGPYGSVGYEIDYEQGAAPDPTPVSRLLDFGHRYSGKLTFADQTSGAIPAQGKQCYTDAQAFAIADSHHDRISFPPVLWLHYTFLNGYNCASNHVAGETYRATSVIIFMPALRSCGLPVIGGSCVADQVLEAAAMAHENGHVMGLCAISMPDLSPPICDGTGHALDKMSLMAPVLDPSSPNVINLTLEGKEVQLLNEL